MTEEKLCEVCDCPSERDMCDSCYYSDDEDYYREVKI
jgi:hypothetical protein